MTQGPRVDQPWSDLERELRGVIARYEAILASTLDPIVTIDAFGVVQAASDSIERVFGWPPAELIGNNVSVLMAEPQRTNHDGYLASYRKTGKTGILGRTREFTARRRDGAEFPIELRVARTRVPGGEELFTGIIRDITERRQAEDELSRHREQLQELVEERTADLEASQEQLRLADRLAAIGTLAAGVGHDMANILLPVRCRLDALEAMAMPEGAVEHLVAFRRSLDYLQQLADGLHLLSLDPDDAGPVSEGTDVASWWEQIGSLLGRGLPKHVRLETAVGTDLPRAAIAPHRLTQAVLNLVVNAGEAVGDRGTVRVWAEPCGGRRGVRIGVTDDGPGMTAEVRRRAFDPFFTTKRRGLGTGLGLSLVQGVVRAAGGTVLVETEPGRGTTVILTLPVQQAGEGRVGGVTTGSRATMSLADPRVAALVAMVLDRAGFEVDHAVEPGPGTALWVADATAPVLEHVRGLGERSSMRAVIAGPAGEAWTALDAVTIVNDPEDFEAWREGIAEAISSLAGVIS